MDTEAALRAALPKAAPPPGRDARVPVRNPEIRGPLDIYYNDYLTEALGPDADLEAALTRRRDGERLAYETLNLVDGRRTVAAIRDVLAGRYEPVPVSEVAEYLELLARARVLSWR